MKTVAVTSSQFRQEQSRFLDEAQRTPISIMSRGKRTRAVVVSPEFFAKAVEALEDKIDVHAAELARNEVGEITHDDLKRELGLD